MEFRIGAAIEHGFYENGFRISSVFSNGIRKPFGQQPVIAKSFRVNSGRITEASRCRRTANPESIRRGIPADVRNSWNRLSGRPGRWQDDDFM